MTNVSFIGLGSMGSRIAANLLAAGNEVTVWNRSSGKDEDLVAAGAHRAADVAEALQTGTVFSMLANDQAFTETFLDSGVLAQAPAGAVHVNMATVSTDLARRAAGIHAEQGVGYVAAPVFGRPPVAEAGKLNILAAGEPALIDRVQPLLDVVGSRTWRMGERPEQGNLVKILGNYLMASAIESMSEAVSVAEASGVDAGDLIEVLSSTMFPGQVYGTYGRLIADRTYQPAGFTTELGRKDLRLGLDAARAQGIELPIGEVLREVFDQAIEEGHGADDWSVISELQRRRRH